MFRRSFFFGSEQGRENAVLVTKEDLYGENCGYGFVTEKNRRKYPLLQIPELNAGFDTVYWYRGEDITRIGQTSKGCYVEGEYAGCEAGWKIPLCFKADVPRQGNYRVTIVIEPDSDIKDVAVFTGRRHLLIRVDHLIAHEVFKRTTIVNVCDIVPRGKTRVHEDKSIDIAVTADHPCISALEIEEVALPTIYIAGDSTVTDQSAAYPYAPGASYAGWGQMLDAFLGCGAGVSNHSHSGLTTESFRKEGHYAVIEQYSKPKDYFFFQFGHNDQKLDHLKARDGYFNNLAAYISECREKGAFPLLVTPVARNSWKGSDGSYNDMLSEYARVCYELGEEMEIPVIGLHERSMEFIKGLGLEGAKKYFYPNDFTHNNDYGAYKMAQFVAEEIVTTCKEHAIAAYRQLADCIISEQDEWGPLNKTRLLEKPKAYADIADPEKEEKLFENLENPEELICRAEALDFVIKMARFFPINVYNDMFDDVVGHEWYAGTVECAYINGIIMPEMCDGKLFHPKNPVTLEEFIVFAMNGYKSRRLLPMEKPCCYDGQTQKYTRPFVRAAYTLGVLDKNGGEAMQAKISRGRAAQICKALQV